MASRRAKAALASGAGAVALCVTYLVVPWEGDENRAYWDRLGHVWTICSGDTLGVKRGDYRTDEECRASTAKRMEADFHQPLRRCIPKFDEAPLSVQVAMLDLSWNVGVQTVCKSTAATRVRLHDWHGACDAMALFNKAGGRVIYGLDIRRKNGDADRIGERELCLAGLP